MTGSLLTLGLGVFGGVSSIITLGLLQTAAAPATQGMLTISDAAVTRQTVSDALRNNVSSRDGGITTLTVSDQ